MRHRRTATQLDRPGPRKKRTNWTTKNKRHLPTRPTTMITYFDIIFFFSGTYFLFFLCETDPPHPDVSRRDGHSLTERQCDGLLRNPPGPSLVHHESLAFLPCNIITTTVSTFSFYRNVTYFPRILTQSSIFYSKYIHIEFSLFRSIQFWMWQ